MPRLDADLRYEGGVLSGTITNRSETPLESVAVSWGRGVQIIDTLAPGATATISLPVATVIDNGRSLSELVFGPYPTDGVRSRTEMTRRQVLDQLWWSSGMGYGSTQQGPVIMAWTSGPELGISGRRPRQAGR